MLLLCSSSASSCFLPAPPFSLDALSFEVIASPASPVLPLKRSYSLS